MQGNDSTAMPPDCKTIASDIPLFPDQEAKHGSTVGPSREILEKVRLPESGPISFVLVGCVDYRSTLDSVHHQTRFAYLVARPHSPFDGVLIGFKPIGSISGLGLMDSMTGGAVD